MTNLNLYRNRPNLHIYQPVLKSSAYIGDIKKYASNYNQTIRLIGGYWLASFDLPGMTTRQQKDFFMKRIGSHVVSKFGGDKVFEGFIWSMQFEDQGIIRRISYEDIRNKVRTSYRSLAGEDDMLTTWVEDTSSQSAYGIIEETLQLRNVETITAETYADTYLLHSGRPYPNPVSISLKNKEGSSLSVEIAGYVFTLNFRYLDYANAQYNISDAIDYASTTNNEFISKGKLESNTVKVVPPSTRIRCWDWISELVDIGDGSNLFKYQIFNDRKFIYEKISIDPVLVWNGKVLSTRVGRSANIHPYKVRPGIFRDMTWTKGHMETGRYYIPNMNDVLITEVEAGEANEMPVLKTEHYDDEELLAAYIDNQIDVYNWLEEQKEEDEA